MSKYRKKNDNQEYLKEFKQHQEKIILNLELLSKADCFKDYFYLNKLLNPKKNSLLKKLHSFNKFAYYNKVLNPSTAKDGSLTIFVSNRHLAKQYGGDLKVWSKAINTYFFLGMLTKYVYTDLQDTQAKRHTRYYKEKLQRKLNRTTYAIAHYSIPKYDNELLSQANEKAKLLIENKYTIETFGKNWLKLNFGIKVAAEIYPYEKPNDPLDDTIKYLLKSHITSSIKKQGYITPKELQLKVIQSLLRELPNERGISKKVKQIYRLHIDPLLNGLGFELRNADKELQDKFNLKTHIKIIYEPPTLEQDYDSNLTPF